MALLFEGTLSIDGLAIPARLELAIDRGELAALLGGSPALANNVAGDDSGRQWVVSPEPAALPAPAPPARYRRRAIVAEDLEGKSEEEQYALFIEGFTGSGKETSFLASWARDEYRKLTGKAYKGEAVELLNDGEPDELSQLDHDWLTVASRLGELVTDQGRPVSGLQSRIAELLGGTNEGHFRRTRVMPLVERFLEWVENSSSSTQGDEADEGGETGEKQARVA